MRQKQGVFSLFLLSPSSRRAWIEIARAGIRLVDAVVALLAEGVDRNSQVPKPSGTNTVALLAEGVDRNSLYHRQYTEVKSSPSSRRAWIEIRMILVRF